MRYLVVSDIHSNLDALEASLQVASAVTFDHVICCGDIVGYGPDPNETVDRIRGLNPVIVRGNHDRVAAGLSNAEDFNAYARAAIEWTRGTLSRESARYLAEMPVGPLRVDDAVLCHGSIQDEDDYIFTEEDAGHNLRVAGAPIVFFGHSHLAGTFAVGADGSPSEIQASIVPVRSGWRYLVNPGSVGQPRDGDSRASFAVWDTGRRCVEFHRAEYDVAAVQYRMRQVGLPHYLASRLSRGR